MKILVADDELIDRRLVTAFLTKNRYELVVVESGRKAIECARAFEEPYVAILDWVMPEVNGMDACRALRAAKSKIRPYIIILSAKSDRADVAEALDAGADDFLSKPFNTGELLARLRVAERTLQYQLAQQRHIDELEALAIRYNLLGELISRQSAPPWSGPVADVAGNTAATAQPKVNDASAMAAAQPGPEPADPAASEKPAEPPPLLGPDDINKTVAHVMKELGLALEGTLSVSTAGAYLGADYTAWAGLQAVREELWFDLLLEIDRASLEVFFQTTLRRPPGSETEQCRMLAEMHTLLSSALRALLGQKGAVVLAPFLSKSMRTDRNQALTSRIPRQRLAFRYNFAGGSIGLTVITERSAVRKKSPSQLRVADILAEQFPPPWVNEVPLLNQGTVLTERFIDKLTTFGDVNDEDVLLPVFHESALASFFNKED